MGKDVDRKGTRQPKVESHITFRIGSYAAAQGVDARRRDQQIPMSQTKMAQTMTLGSSAYVGARPGYTNGANEDGADIDIWGVNRCRRLQWGQRTARLLQSFGYK